MLKTHQSKYLLQAVASMVDGRSMDIMHDDVYDVYDVDTSYESVVGHTRWLGLN